MRIGIDARLWSESGVGRYTRNLILQLQKIDKKNEYVLFVLSKDYENIKCSNNWKLKIGNWRLRRADVRWHTLEEQLRLPGILNKEKLDLVHFPYFSVPIFYNKQFIVTIHDLILHHFPTGQASTLPRPFYWAKLFGYKFVISQAAKKAQKIITVSNATKQEIVKKLHVDQSKIVVTYEGIDFDKSKIKNQKSKVQIKSQKYFLYIGNAYPHKNLERLIDVFSTLNSQFSTLNLVLVGKEDFFYKRLKEKVKQMKLENSIVFYGEATDQELLGLYKNAVALVAPSFMEGFGLPVLEAMSQKCLVLASDIPSHREIAGDAAIYFDPNNVKEIAEKMKTIHFNDTNHYSGYIQKGIELTKMFSWEKMAKGTLRVYESCIGI